MMDWPCNTHSWDPHTAALGAFLQILQRTESHFKGTLTLLWVQEHGGQPHAQGQKKVGQCHGWAERGGTSGGCCEFSPADEPKVSCSSPERLSSIAKAEASVEVICLKSLTVIDGVVATGCMGTVHPNL